MQRVAPLQKVVPVIPIDTEGDLDVVMMWRNQNRRLTCPSGWIAWIVSMAIS